jgi:hypothetical protein
MCMYEFLIENGAQGSELIYTILKVLAYLNQSEL